MPVREVASNPAGFRVIELPEWATAQIDGVEFTDEDRASLGDLIDGQDDRVELMEQKDGIRIRAKSWAGTIRFSGFELRIIPKLPGALPDLARMLCHAAGFEDLNIYRSTSQVDMTGQSLLELVALMLAGECERLVRGGLLCDYRETEDALPFLRGRLMPERQYLRRFGILDRVECRYDEHVTDIVENRLLLLALRVCVRRIESPDLSRRLSRLVHLFVESCDLDEFDPSEARLTISYNRRNEHYRSAHTLAWFILDALGIRDTYQGKTRCHAFLFDMNPLFERLLGKWLSKVVASAALDLFEQDRNREVIWNAATNRPYSSIRPDFVLKEKGTGQVRLAIDAKYKRYGMKNVDPSDVYQAFVYAFGLVGHQKGGAPPEAFLVYPAEGERSQVGPLLQVRNNGGETGARITVLGVSIPDILDYLDGTKATEWVGDRILTAAIQGSVGECGTRKAWTRST